MISVWASIHDWCGRLDDPANGLPCPCSANTVTRRDVERRHRAAVWRAKTRGWPVPARRRAAAARQRAA